jgi:hypothetical protein
MEDIATLWGASLNAVVEATLKWAEEGVRKY